MMNSNSKFKTLGGVSGRSRFHIGEHKDYQMLPTIEPQILGEGENVLKEAFASTALLANLLVGGVH